MRGDQREADRTVTAGVMRLMRTRKCAAGDVHHRARVPVQERLEIGGGEAQEIGVANRVHGGRARQAGKEGDVTRGSTAADLFAMMLAVRVVAGHHSQPAVADEIDVAALVPLVEERLAGLEVHPLELAGDRRQRFALERAEVVDEQQRELRAAQAQARCGRGSR